MLLSGIELRLLDQVCDLFMCSNIGCQRIKSECLNNCLTHICLKIIYAHIQLQLFKSLRKYFIIGELSETGIPDRRPIEDIDMLHWRLTCLIEDRHA